MLCRYILRPPLANERLHLIQDGSVSLEFKRPWKDGTRSIALGPEALTRLSAIVPPPRSSVAPGSGKKGNRQEFWRRIRVGLVFRPG
jgi:hypothetical protein